MICPSCSRHVSDDALVCPGCGASLDTTRKMSLSGAIWCPACGALAAPGATECPKCGTSLTAEKGDERRKRDIELPEIGNTGMMDALGDAGALHGVESAIPPEDDAAELRVDRLPRTRALVLAGLLAVVVVGGAALLITHPWDPSANRTATTTPADTSMQGFPGFIESLSGQDVASGAGTSTSVADALEQAHDDLGAFSERVDQSEELLRSEGVSGDMSPDELDAAVDAAQAVSLDVSNAIADLSALDDGTYPDALADLTTLGNWLRNRCDALSAAWERAASSDDPQSDADEILSGVNASRDYRRRFAQLYAQWELDEVQTQD